MALGLVLVAGACSESSDPYAGLPREEPDLVRVVDSAVPASAGRVLSEDGGLFFGPHFAMRFHSVGVAPALDEAWASSHGLEDMFRAAAGHELVVAKVALEPVRPRWGTDPAPRAAVVVGDRVTPLEAVPSRGDLIIASVPDGASATLRVTDAGQVHSFDLRRGLTRDGGHQVREATLPTKLYEATGRVRWAGVDQKVDVVMMAPGGKASLESWLPGAGPARPGRAWLLLSPLQVMSSTLEHREPGRGSFEVAFELAVPRSFALRVPGGGVVRAESAPRIRTQTVATSPSSAYFDVPASLRSADLVITPVGPMATVAGPTSVRQFADLDASACQGPRTPCLRWAQPPRPGIVPLEMS